jgi:hypothetical protein
MNENEGFNLLALQRPKGCKVEVLGNHVRIIYPKRFDGSHGVTTGYGPPPRMFTSDRIEASTMHLRPSERRFMHGDPSYTPVEGALVAQGEWGEVVEAAAMNHDLSAAGRHKIWVDATEIALGKIGIEFAKLEDIAAELAQKHARLYAVPARDAVEAVIDVHLYENFERLPTAEQIQRVVAKDADERLLLALARVPSRAFFHKDVLRHIDDAWAAKVRRDKPAETASLALSEAANAWAFGFLKLIGSMLANPSTSRTTGAIDRAELYKKLKSVNAIGLLDFRPEEVVMHERKLESIAV